MLEELAWLEGVPLFVWSRLAALLPAEAPSVLRSTAIVAGHRAAAFVSRKVLGPAQGYPWKLLQGDISENLDALAAETEEVQDPTTFKLQKLLGLKYNKALL
eukprot:1321101-Alexandrium_andersonii.AAC.1